MDSVLRLSWRPTAHQRRLATLGLLAALAAVVTGRPQLLALAAPLLVTLAAAMRRVGPATIRLSTRTTPDRCVEGDEVEVAVMLAPASTPAVRVDLTLIPADTMTLAGLRPTVTNQAPVGPVQARWVVRPTRWGRRSAGVLIVSLRTAGGLTEAVTAVAIGQLLRFRHSHSCAP